MYANQKKHNLQDIARKKNMLTAKQKGRKEQQHQQEILTFCFCIYHKTEPFYVKENRIKVNLPT
jgi:hypothetical protein